MATQLDFEKSLWDKGTELIAGVDEVGRGALAGPMVVGAVILKAEDLKRVYHILTNNDVIKPDLFGTGERSYLQIKDSKLLTPAKREVLSSFILQNCISYSYYQVPADEIDAIGMTACTQKALSGVVKSLKIAPEHVLTDAFPINSIPQFVQTNITKGDRLSITIGAASIIAKVYRDNLMRELGKEPDYINYGFEQHKGYGTSLHMNRIKTHGISNQHRKTFIHL